MLKYFFDGGFVIPLPNFWVKGLALRLFRWDMDPSDRRIGVTIQIEF